MPVNILNAVSIGSTAASLLENSEVFGLVHSTFQRVVNISLPGNNLISISRSDVSNSPTNVVTDLSIVEDYRKYEIRPDMTVSVKDNVMRLGFMFINLEEATRWTPAIYKELTGLPITQIAVNISRLAHWADSLPDSYGLAFFIPHISALLAGDFNMPSCSDHFLEIAFSAITGLCRSLQQADRIGLRENTAKLIGLGPGLTPSGDDLLAGLMASLIYTQKITNRPKAFPIQELCNTVCDLARTRTNDISRQLLTFAAKGEVPETMETFILAVLTKPEAELEPAARQLTNVGASSGSDQLLGIILGISLYVHGY